MTIVPQFANTPIVSINKKSFFGYFLLENQKKKTHSTPHMFIRSRFQKNDFITKSHYAFFQEPPIIRFSAGPHIQKARQ